MKVDGQACDGEWERLMVQVRDVTANIKKVLCLHPIFKICRFVHSPASLFPRLGLSSFSFSLPHLFTKSRKEDVDEEEVKLHQATQQRLGISSIY